MLSYRDNNGLFQTKHTNGMLKRNNEQKKETINKNISIFNNDNNK
jgi:hypothetical protein